MPYSKVSVYAEKVEWAKTIKQFATLVVLAFLFGGL